jgi:hypothetical protein
MRIKTFVVLVTILFSNSLFAEIYKWVDENGRVHYGKKPDTLERDSI